MEATTHIHPMTPGGTSHLDEPHSDTKFFKIGNYRFVLKDIKERFGFHKKSQIEIYCETFVDGGYDELPNIPVNTECKFKEPLTCFKDQQMAFNDDQWGWRSWYPIGDIHIYGDTPEQYDERMKKKTEIKELKQIRKELIDNIKKCNDPKIICACIGLYELETDATPN